MAQIGPFALAGVDAAATARRVNPESHPDSPDRDPHMAFPYDRYLGEIRYWMSGRDFTKPHEIIEIRKWATR